MKNTFPYTAYLVLAIYDYAGATVVRRSLKLCRNRLAVERHAVCIDSVYLPSACGRVREELQRATAAEAEAKAVAEEADHSTLQGERLEAEDPRWSKAAIMKEAMAELEGGLQAAEHEVSEVQYR